MPAREDISTGRGQRAAIVDEILQRAMSAIQSQRPDEAVRLAQDVLNKNPSHPNAMHLFGYALLMQERAEEAIAPLEKAFRSLRDPAIETQLAIALRKAGRLDDALIRLARAVKRKPPFPAAIHEYGYLLYSLDRADEAIDVLKSGIETAPWMPDLPILLGWVFHARNHGIDAKAAFARALGIAPNHTDALYGMGLVLMDAGEFAQASEFFQRALLSDPSDQQSRLYLGACLLELGQTGTASVCLRQVTRGGANFYGKALKVLSSSSRGRFWLQPSAAARFFRGEQS
jgi:tetratricopeptide (TPR) repeat protein